jgi:hypothetical protein
MVGGASSKKVVAVLAGRRVLWDSKCQKGKREKGRQHGKYNTCLPMMLLVLPQVSYHCKHGYDYGSPDPVDILPSSCSGLCLASITNLAFVVLTYLSPSSPDTPAIKQHKRQAEAEQTLHNPCGYGFLYGGLQFIPAPSDEQQPAAQRCRVVDGLADIVSDAVSGAGFLKACWGIIKKRFGVAGEATACSKGPWCSTGCARHAKPVRHARWCECSVDWVACKHSGITPKLSHVVACGAVTGLEMCLDNGAPPPLQSSVQV